MFEEGATADRTLEPDGAVMRRWVEAAMTRIVRHLETLPDQPAGYAFDDPDREPPAGEAVFPEEGRPLEELLDRLFDRDAPESFNTAGPGYMAYIPGGGLFHAALAELVAASLNRYVGVWLAAPRLVQIETDVVMWLCRMMQLPPSARGVLTTGGSMANFTAIVTARRRLLPDRFDDAVLYVSDQAHHSVAKSAVLAGFPPRAVVAVPTDDRFRLRLDRLEALRREDAAAGRRPFLVVASAGTTNTGAVDDLAGAAELCRREGLWLHVDAAYGGFFQLTEEGRRRLAGIERADSVTLDPHKGLFMPYGLGALLVRDGEALRAAHTVGADYMPPMQEEGGGPPRIDFCEHSLELSRGFRGLRAWLPLKMHGIGPFRRNLEEKLALTRRATTALEDMDGVEIVARPQLSIVAFRLAPPGTTEDERDSLNEDLLRRILARQRVWLTATRLRGRFVIRICILSFRTHQDRVDEALEIIREEVAKSV